MGNSESIRRRRWHTFAGSAARWNTSRDVPLGLPTQFLLSSSALMLRRLAAASGDAHRCYAELTTADRGLTTSGDGDPQGTRNSMPAEQVSVRMKERLDRIPDILRSRRRI